MAEDSRKTPTQIKSTPSSILRRSTRKSVRPIQDYEEIISHKVPATSTSENDLIRWTPAKVGRVSKRRNRKSRKTKKIYLSMKGKSEECENDLGCKKLEETENKFEFNINEDSNKENIPEQNNTITIEESPVCEKEMPSLLIQDEHGKVASNENVELKENIQECEKIPEITVTDVDKNTEMFTSLEDESAILINSSSDSLIASGTDTPKVRRPPGYRFPTPYKSKDSVNLSFTCKDSEEIALENAGNLQKKENKLTLTNLEPKELVLQSIRKRSLSVTVGENKRKNVTFHSPSNMITEIEQIDQQMFFKGAVERDDDKMAKRRKRSSSLNEKNFEHKENLEFLQKFKSNVQSKICRTPDATRKLIQPISRTKMPNFAVIHQQNFKKMESISDHIVRKAERAKAISNSATKSGGPPSSQKKLLAMRDFTKDDNSKPKARQRINLPTTPLKTVENMKENQISKPKSLVELAIASKSKVSKLPTIKKQLNNKQADIAKSCFQFKANKSTLTLSHIENRLNRSAAISSQIPKPKFNLSTAIDNTKTDNKICLASTSSFIAEKTADRRNKFENMYKSRTNVRLEGKKHRDEILRGVRTNRRFELQMMCRNASKTTEGGK